MIKASLLLALSLLLSTSPGAPQGGGLPTAPRADDGDAVRLLTEHDGTMLRLRGAFTGQANVTGTLRYQLTVEKQGASGRSTSRQGGAFAAPAPGVTDTLSHMQIGVQEGDRVEATLTVHREAQLLGEAHLDTVLQR